MSGCGLSPFGTHACSADSSIHGIAKSAEIAENRGSILGCMATPRTDLGIHVPPIHTGFLNGQDRWDKLIGSYGQTLFVVHGHLKGRVLHDSSVVII